MTPEYEAELREKVVEFQEKARAIWAKRGMTQPPKEALDLARRYLRKEAS